MGHKILFADVIQNATGYFTDRHSIKLARASGVKQKAEASEKHQIPKSTYLSYLG